jgi:hypothetical protein
MQYHSINHSHSTLANVTDMSGMFENAYSFNQPLSFNTTNVTNMYRMFEDATLFNLNQQLIQFTDS